MVAPIITWVRIALEFAIDFLFPPSLRDAQIVKLSGADLMQHLAPRTKNGVLILFYYRDPIIRRMIALLKYHRNEHTVQLFASIAADYLLLALEEKRLFENFENPLMVPVPLSPARLRERRYNQAELLARALLAEQPALGNLAPRALEKIRNTLPQTALKRRERLTNVRGAFRAASEVSGRNILLIDDVTTTGTTLGECRAALQAAGARSVLSVAIAG